MQQIGSAKTTSGGNQEKKASQKHVPERSYVAEGISTKPTKRVHFVHNCVCTCPVQEREGLHLCLFVFSFFSHFYKYDRSYKMLSHLKVHSILFFNYRKYCHHNKLLKHITSILGRGLHHIPMVNCISQYNSTKKDGGGGVLKYDTSTERGKRSRGQETL